MEENDMQTAQPWHEVLQYTNTISEFQGLARGCIYGVLLRLPDRSPGPEKPLTKEEIMTISIEYCGTCNYRPIAASLAMAIEKETGIKPLLVHSKEPGVLEVRVDSDLIFSKKQTGRFPDHAEVMVLLEKKQ